MKAKYQHEGNDCMIYNQVIYEDNIFVAVESSSGSWLELEPKVETKVCPTNAEARRLFFGFCNKFENKHYQCIYKEEL